MSKTMMHLRLFAYFFFFFNDTATTEIYTLSLHDALPILALSLSYTRPTWGGSILSHRPLTSPCGGRSTVGIVGQRVNGKRASSRMLEAFISWLQRCLLSVLLSIMLRKL